MALLGTAATAWGRSAGPGRAAAAVQATDADSGRPLPDHPSLAPGVTVSIDLSGYASGARVTVGLVGRAILGATTADKHGRVKYRFTVPNDRPGGLHTLIFSGPGAGPFERPGGGNLHVAVPLNLRWRFGTPAPPPGGGVGGYGPGHGGGSGGSGASAGASGAASGGAGAGAGAGDGDSDPGRPGAGAAGPSATGIDVAGWLAVAALALVAGGVALVLGRAALSAALSAGRRRGRSRGPE